MNLTTDPWLPAVLREGQPVTVSLREAFARAHEIRDLALRPHERIAVMRLLLCMTHAALDGPANRKEWRACRDRIAPTVEKYLARPEIAGGFNLFGNAERFLQVANLKSAKADDDEGGLPSKMDMALATGSNSTLFDHAGSSERSLKAASHALNLLAFQCFSPGGTIGVGLWGGKPTLGWTKYPKPAPGKSSHAPCLPGSMLHTLLRGSNLLETLHLNLLNQELVAQALGENRWGRPVWEHMPASAADKNAVENATRTYLGRLVPLTRAIRLEDDGRSLLLANALDFPGYDEGFREPTATIITRADGEERAPLGASLDRAPWRQLHAQAVRRTMQNSTGGPLALDNLDGSEAFDLWVGALVADKAKILDTLESVFPHLPAALLDESGQRAYERGIKHAEETASRLWKAVFVYHKQIGDSLDRPDAKSRRDLLHGASSRSFWTEAEQALPLLLALVEDPAELGLEDDYGKSRWGEAIRLAARRAYELACPRETSRQMQAFVIGLKQLSQPKLETANA
jgi:CRISPR system Cascade subunit CasA